jgi:hypothetical protein
VCFCVLANIYVYLLTLRYLSESTLIAVGMVKVKKGHIHIYLNIYMNMHICAIFGVNTHIYICIYIYETNNQSK